MKKTITFNQLKKLVKEGRFTDKISGLDSSEFGDKEAYQNEKWRTAIKKEVDNLFGNEDYREAIQLIDKLYEVAWDRISALDDEGADDESDKALDQWNDGSADIVSDNMLWGYVASDNGELVFPDGTDDGGVGILHDDEQPYTYPYLAASGIRTPANPALTVCWDVKANKLRVGFYKKDSNEFAECQEILASRASTFSDAFDKVVEAGAVKQFYRLLVKMNRISDTMIDEAESLYDWATKLPWFKNKEFNPNPEDVDEGRFAKRLAALGEGRFAKQLASLDAMMEGDEPVKLNEGTKVTLTLKQLKKLVKEGAMFDSDEDQAAYDAQEKIISKARQIGYAMVDAAIEKMETDAQQFPDVMDGDPDFLLGNYLIDVPHAQTVVDGYLSMKN